MMTRHFWIAGVTLTAFIATNAFAIPFQSLELPATIISKSIYYTLDSDVQDADEPGFLKFRVSAVHANYVVEGIPSLQKLLHEIEVIEKIRRNEEGSGFFDGLANSVEQTGEGFIRLVNHPIESVKGIGKAAGVLGHKIGGVFRKKEKGEKTTFGDTFLGASERELAKQFGVDVYTNNPYLKELLHRMAKARLGGKGAALIGNLLLPVAGIVSVAVTASGVNSTADQIVNDQNKSNLFRMNKDALSAMNFAAADINDFLNSPYYSPREATYLRFYLEKLKTVEGHREIFKVAVRAKSDWDSRKILNEAQVAADTADKNTYQNIECFEEGLAIEETDCTIFITPYDYLGKSPLGDRVLARIAKINHAWKKKSVELWNSGKVTTDFSAQALRQGVKTKNWLLFQG